MIFDPRLVEIAEPDLQFGFSQAMAHPKDGLSLYGPLRGALSGGRLRIGVVATANGLRLYKQFAERIMRPILPAKPDDPNHTHFPGFQAVFGVEWPVEPLAFIDIDPDRLADAIRVKDRHQAIHKAVSLYSEAIADHLRDASETPIDVWMAVVPEDVHRYCRPKSKVGRSEAIEPDHLMNKKAATRMLTNEPSLFAEDNRAAEIYLYDLDFHNQLKARLLEHKAAVQVVRETTLAPNEFLNAAGKPLLISQKYRRHLDA